MSANAPPTPSSGKKSDVVSPLVQETKRLAEAYDGAYWNQMTPGRRRPASQISTTTTTTPATTTESSKKAKVKRRMPLAAYLASQLDGDYWSAGVGERRRMVSRFVDRSFAADDDEDDDDEDDDGSVSVLITRSVVESPSVPKAGAAAAAAVAVFPRVKNPAAALAAAAADDDDEDEDVIIVSNNSSHAGAAAAEDLNADVSDDEENDDYDDKGNLLYSVPPSDRVGLNDGMDGLYWLLSGDVRPRRSRELHTYASDHIPWAGRKRAPVVLSAEQEAARREQQQRRQAEERVAREKSLEAYLERVKFESEGFAIAERLWLGSRHVIANQAWMRASGIDSVLNLTTKTFGYGVADSAALQVVTIPIEDSGHAADAMLAELGRACDAIERWLAAGRTVLVHCQHGLSRSPSVLIAYLVARRNYTLQDAYDHVSGARRGLRINDGFLRALVTWELQCRPTLARSTLKSFHRGGKGMQDDHEPHEQAV